MHGRRVLRVVILIAVCVLIASYALFQARKVIEGPMITIDSPADGILVTQAHIEITGRAKNIAFLYLNGKKIYTNDQGIFREITLVATGTNVLELRAADKFGKEIIRRFTVFRN